MLGRTHSHPGSHAAHGLDTPELNSLTFKFNCLCKNWYLDPYCVKHQVVFFTLLVEAIFLILAAMSFENVLNPNESSTDNMLGSWHFRGDKDVARNHVSACTTDYILHTARQWDTCDDGMLGQTPTETRQDMSCGFLATHTLQGVKKYLLSLLGVRVALSNSPMGTKGTGPPLPRSTENSRLAFRAESCCFP